MSSAFTLARRLVANKATSSNASLFASTATRAISTQPFAPGHARTSDSCFFAMAAAATAVLTTTSVGAVVVNCEREGVVRDPKTAYGLHAENAVKMELKRRMTELQGEPSTKVLEPLDEGVPLELETSAVVVEEIEPVSIKATSPAPAPSSPADPMAEPSTLMTPEEARLEAATLKAKKHGGGLKLFSGNGNMTLSLEIAKLLGVNLGRATVSSFADGEINVMIHENVRGKDVYIIQPTCTPVNNNLMELLLMVSCLNRASARRVTVVIPYYGYARQDRKMAARVPISAADVARLLESMGVDRVIAVDLHCGQIQGFFGPRVPVDNLEGGIVGVDHFGGKDLHNPVIVSPDAGGVYRAKKFKELLAYKYGWEDIGIAMIIKQRARAGSVDQMDLVGDVKDCDCIIVDDMIDTAGTLCKAADVLKAQGARRVFAFASHGLLSGPGNERIANSNLEECVILNTIPSTPQRVANEKLVELSVAPLLAQTIFNIHAKRIAPRRHQPMQTTDSGEVALAPLFKIFKRTDSKFETQFRLTSHFVDWVTVTAEIKTMAEEGTAVALKGVSITAAEKCIKAKEMLVGVDMPQDYSFPSDEVAAVLIGADSNIATAAKPVSSATAHAWVSPNKSDEVPSSEESSPTCDDLKINEKELAESGINANLNAEFDGEFETTESVEASDPDLSIIGKRLEVQNLVGTSNVEAVLDATGKDFIRIVHGEKAVMMVLPSVGYPLGSALDFAEALAASLDITDNIVGLRTSALAFNSQSSVFKYHGECILPFSALVSGELAKMIDSSDLSDGIPSFALITSSFDSYLTNSYQVGSVESVEALSSKEESSVGSVNDGPSYAKAFLQLMEESGDFTPFEKNALLKFGIGHAENGNILYRSSFRVAVFTGSKSYFIRGLKAIANILLNSSPEVNKSNEYNTDYPTKTSMTIFGITDFVISAEELYDSNDLSEQEYVTLLDAIIVGHASVRALFDLYHNPDFLLACDSNEDIQSSLCLRDLFHLGKKLEPLQPQPETDDGLLKWAIKTGIHNFSADVPELSQEFINIIFHMFSSGDEMVLAACEKFVETGDTGFVSEMILREWNIYCRNNTVREEDCISSPKLVQQETSECAEVPNCLLTAVACLVDEDEMANDEAVALIASYLQGDQLLHEVYGHFIEFGNVDDFLMMLKVIASTEKVNDDSARTGTVVSAEDASADVGSDFWPVLEEMKRDNQFGQVEIAALRLATAMKDPRLTQVLADYRSNCIDKETFKRFILDVADGVIEENC